MYAGRSGPGLLAENRSQGRKTVARDHDAPAALRPREERCHCPRGQASLRAQTPQVDRWHWQLAIFLAAAFLVFSRVPHCFLHAQFSAEDGHVWFADAYNLGWKALFRSQDGYYQTLPRVAAALALLFPISAAPLVLNLIGTVCQVLPVNVLLSSRCRTWGPLHVRAVLAFLYLALPNSSQLQVTVTEAQ